MEPKISIITICFNDRDGLEDTIASVAELEYKAIEYVVVDGGSTDGTLELIKSKAGLVTKYLSEPDRGIYDAMNKGLQISEGDYVIFMNAGDRFVNKQTLNMLSGSFLAASPYVIYGDHLVIGAQRNNGYRKAMSIHNIHKGMICCHQSMLFSRSCFGQRGFSCEYGPSGDYEFLLYLIRNNCRFEYKSIPVSIFSGGGLSDQSRLSTVYNGIKALKTHKFLNTRSFTSFSFLLMRAALFQAYMKLKKVRALS